MIKKKLPHENELFASVLTFKTEYMTKTRVVQNNSFLTVTRKKNVNILKFPFLFTNGVVNDPLKYKSVVNESTTSFYKLNFKELFCI